jgi:hypothetical protein
MAPALVKKVQVDGTSSQFFANEKLSSRFE